MPTGKTGAQQAQRNTNLEVNSKQQIRHTQRRPFLRAFELKCSIIDTKIEASYEKARGILQRLGIVRETPGSTAVGLTAS